MDEEPSDEAHLFNAMEAAKNAFEKYFEDEGLDGVYWQLAMDGHVLDMEFAKWKRIRIEDVT